MKKLLFLSFLIILLPFIIFCMTYKEKIMTKIKYGIVKNEMIKLKREETGNIEVIPLEKYVLGVVAGEMPATFNIEALKAQAVASRTYVLKNKMQDKEYDVVDGVKNQVYLTEEVMKKNWKDNYYANYNKIKKAVSNTKGEVILYNNNLIDAMFFSTSNGYTENSEDVFATAQPYLRSVESFWDEKASPVFNSTQEISKNEFLLNLGLSAEEIKIGSIEKTKSNRVKKIMINNKEYKGTEIRKIFHLKSTCFNIVVKDNIVVFEVKGNGHGVGMSQYGANAMANEGYNYKEILKYYYQKTEVKKLN